MLTKNSTGHARPEFMILIAIVGVALAIAIPAYQKQGIKGVLLSALYAIGIVIGSILVIGLLAWLYENLDREGESRSDQIIRWISRLFLFTCFLLCGLMISMPIAVVPELGKSEPLAYLLATAFAICCSVMFHRLGAERFWPAFRRFGAAFVCSLFGGLLGMLVPGDWGIRLGAAIPLIIFFILLGKGYVIPSEEPIDPDFVR